jgi:oligoribonuclease
LDFRNKKPTKYLWLDMEMTGLDVNKEKIIEVAAIITDTDLNEISDYHAVIFQPDEILKKMDDWNQKQHKSTGLLNLIPTGKPEGQVESELIEWIKTHYKNEKPILAGNSIAQDKLFIDFHMPKLKDVLHYRMLDVTSWKIPFWIQNIEMKKKNVHRAVDDIRESISEFKTYLKFVDFHKPVDYNKK